MLSQFTRTATAFAIVFVAYAIYALTVAPWVAPPAVVRPVASRGGFNPRSDRMAQQFAPLFPADAWELKQPKVLRTEQGTLFFQQYTTVTPSQIELKPVTIVFDRASDDNKPGGSSRKFVMRAPEGATLNFDSPVDLVRGKIGQIMGGQLFGDVTITSPATAPGADDELQIETRNVRVETRRMWTPEAVRFRLGRNRGSGRDLVVTFNPLIRNRALSDDSEPIKLLELVHVDMLHLELVGGSPFPGKSPSKPPAKKSPLVGDTVTPVDITCAGPFRFDFERNVASLEDRVDIVRANVDGPSDQLNCQALSIFFRPRKPDGNAADKDGKRNGLTGLAVERIEALGHPAILRAPSVGAHARGERLEYDFRTKRVRLEDSQKVLFRQEQHEIEAANLEYEMGEDSRMVGRLVAAGPGALRTEDGQRKQPLIATWRKELRLAPQDDEHLASLTGGASVDVPETGEFSASEIHLWLRQAAKAVAAKDKRPALEPQRMLAVGRVDFDSSQLSGKTNRLEVWLRAEPTPVQAAVTQPLGPLGERPGEQPGERAENRLANRDKKPGQKFHLEGDLIRVQIRRGERSQLEDVTVEENVKLTETRSADPAKEPLLLTGQRLQVRGNRSDRPTVHVFGEPATIAAQGMTAVSSNLHLSQESNTLWIDGAGEMSFRGELPGAPDRPRPKPNVATPQAGKITWTGRVHFDGHRVRFERDVRVTALQRMENGSLLDVCVDGGVLEVELTAPIDFVKPQAKTAALAQLAFVGPVSVENRGRTVAGEPESWDRMQLRDLQFNQQTGAFHGLGPGWVSTVRRGGEQLALGEGFVPPRSPATPAPRAGDLTYLHVDFRDNLQGNFQRRDLQFKNYVKTIYGPVTAWDQKLGSERREDLGERGFLLTCQQLTVAEIGPKIDGQPAVELQAIGNAVVEGQQGTARGHRISYSRAKDLLVLEGDGRTDAMVWLQGKSSPDAQAGRVLYWRKTNQVEVDDAKFFDFSRLGRMPAAPPK